MFRRSLLGWLTAFVVAGIGVGLEWRRSPAIFTPSGVLFVDPDDFMRLVRVRSIMEGGPRIIRRDTQINWPHGVEPHWTAPMDYLLVVANALFGGFSRQDDRLAGTAAWVPVWLGLAYSLVMMAMIRRACGWGPALVAGGMIVLSPAYHRVFQLGHPDHHCLLELLFAISVAAWVPRRDDRGPARIPARSMVLVGGFTMGLAIWIAPQAVPVWAAILFGATFATFHATPEDRAIWATRRRDWSLAALGVVVLGYFIENTSNLGEVAVDKISLFHVALALGALLVPSGSSRIALGKKVEADPGFTYPGMIREFIFRSGVFALASVIFFGWIVVDRERIYRYARSEELLRWWAIVVELQPLYTHAGGQWSLAPLQAHLGFAAYAMPLLLYFFVRSKTLSCGAKLTLALLSIGITALAVYQRRWLDHVNIGLVPVTVIGVCEMLRLFSKPNQVDNNGGLSQTYIARIMATLLILGIIQYPSTASVIDPPVQRTTVDVQCARAAYVSDRIKAHEAAHPPAVSERQAILCDEGAGPILLYRTRLPVVAAPYHRAINGIVAAARFYAERDPIEARRILYELGVRYVVVPFRPHEQLINFERVAFGEMRSYDPPEQSVDAEGNIQERLKYRPGIDQTAIYRLTLQGGGGIPGLELVESIAEGATTPDGRSGLLYVVRD